MRKNAGVLILSLTISFVLLFCGLSLKTSGQGDTVDYVQLCTDFIQENYPNKTIVRPSTAVDGPNRETGFTYTILVAELMPGTISPTGDPVTVSIRHDTQNIEFGRDQISRDWDEYYESLPDYYKKITHNGREGIVSNVGYLPMPSDPILGEYCSKARINFNPENQTIVIDRIEDMGGCPVYNYNGDEIRDDTVQANLTLENILILANESYVSTIHFYSVYDYVPTSSGTPFPGLMMMISTALLLAVIFRWGIRKKNV